MSDTKKKSVIEEALLDADRIQEALKSNTKEILRSVAKEEIDGLVKESINEDDYEEEDVEDETSDSEELAGDEIEGGDEEIEIGDEEAGEEEEESGDIEGDYEGDEEGDMEGGEEESYDDMEGGEEESYDDMEDSEGYMDMTSASDEDVIAVYKKLSGDDEIEVVSDDEVHIKDPESGSEYHIKLNGDDEAVEDEGLGMEMYGESEAGITDESTDVTEEVVYEIALDEKDINEDKVRTATSDVHMGTDGTAPNTGDIDDQDSDELPDDQSGDNLQGGFPEDEATQDGGEGKTHADHVMEGEGEVNEDEVNEDEVAEEDVAEGDEVDEVITKGQGSIGKHGMYNKDQNDIGQPKGPGVDESVSIQKYNKLMAEAKELKKQNQEFRGALKKFRRMLGETVVFNTNLTNVTRLFMEHSTTKEEKESILKRFDDEVSTIKESKKLYKSIANELGSREPINESIDKKISKEATSSSSTQLNESTAYVDQETRRVIDLINRVEKNNE